MAATTATACVQRPLLRVGTISRSINIIRVPPHPYPNGILFPSLRKKLTSPPPPPPTSITALATVSSKSPAFPLVAALPPDLFPPPIDHDLLETLTEEGAKVSEDGIVGTFDNDDEALDAFDKHVVVSDLSHFGRIRVTGDDRAHFLHNQTTANFECLREGQGCDTVFVTPTARTIDIAHAWIMKNSIMLSVSPATCGTITQMLNKYIFFADKVEIQDITKKTSFFILAGPESSQVMENLNLGELVGQPYGTHRHYSVNGMPITVGVGNPVSEEGYSLLMSPASAESVWKTLLTEGAIPMGSNAWEKLRIIQGGAVISKLYAQFTNLDLPSSACCSCKALFMTDDDRKPASGKELTNEFNVLEAHLWNSISLNKGCYKGQETISRLITYDGVKQRLWGIHLSAPAEPGSQITVDGKKVGKLTSYTSGIKGSKHYGLAYIKRQIASDGSAVIVGDNIPGTLVDPPFLSRQRPLLKGASA